MNIKKINSYYGYLIILFSVFLVLTLSRLIPHPPNFTPVIACTVIGCFVAENIKIRLLILIGSMLVSDFIIGFHDLMIFTYILIFFLLIIANKKNYKYMIFINPLIFYLTTNFLVWLTSGMYDLNLTGLIECYLLGLPFYGYSFLSTIFYSILFLYFFEKKELLSLKKKYIIYV